MKNPELDKREQEWLISKGLVPADTYDKQLCKEQTMKAKIKQERKSATDRAIDALCKRNKQLIAYLEYVEVEVSRLECQCPTSCIRCDVLAKISKALRGYA
ncbi:hypothetical protein KAR91_62100 [Candidatus Pacearchaeota archaeon]|nr:hypothetical protein [Candidatus Pacearchaeota archaeon]